MKFMSSQNLNKKNYFITLFVFLLCRGFNIKCDIINALHSYVAAIYEYSSSICSMFTSTDFPAVKNPVLSLSYTGRSNSIIK